MLGSVQRDCGHGLFSQGRWSSGVHHPAEEQRVPRRRGFGGYDKLCIIGSCAQGCHVGLPTRAAKVCGFQLYHNMAMVPAYTTAGTDVRADAVPEGSVFH